MNARTTLALLALSLAMSSPFAATKEPTEAQCREMVSGMLSTMRSTPLKTEEDKRLHREYMAPLEKKLSDIRARGGTECECWAAIADHVTK